MCEAGLYSHILQQALQKYNFAYGLEIKKVFRTSHKMSTEVS